MSTQHIETPDPIPAMLEKLQELKERVAGYEQIDPTLPERYAQMRKRSLDSEAGEDGPPSGP
jgi:hypothetical protein